MTPYETYITIEDPNQVTLFNLPFQKGQKIKVIMMQENEENNSNLVDRWKQLLKKTQQLHADNPLTEEEIAAEIDAYRRGE